VTAPAAFRDPAAVWDQLGDAQKINANRYAAEHDTAVGSGSHELTLGMTDEIAGQIPPMPFIVCLTCARANPKGGKGYYL